MARQWLYRPANVTVALTLTHTHSLQLLTSGRVCSVYRKCDSCSCHPGGLVARLVVSARSLTMLQNDTPTDGYCRQDMRHRSRRGCCCPPSLTRSMPPSLPYAQLPGRMAFCGNVPYKKVLETISTTTSSSVHCLCNQLRGRRSDSSSSGVQVTRLRDRPKAVV